MVDAIHGVFLCGFCGIAKVKCIPECSDNGKVSCFKGSTLWQLSR